jgi:hypothetical protein
MARLRIVLIMSAIFFDSCLKEKGAHDPRQTLGRRNVADALA